MPSSFNRVPPGVIFNDADMRVREMLRRAIQAP